MILSRAEQAVLVALLVLVGLGLVAFGYLAALAGCVVAGVLVANRRT